MGLGQVQAAAWSLGFILPATRSAALHPWSTHEAAFDPHNRLITQDLCSAEMSGNQLDHPLCDRWPDFDARSWREATEDARDARKTWAGNLMLGCDIHSGALDLAAM